MKSDGHSARPEHRDTRLRFEHWARNPRCHANTLSAVHGISMSEVATAEGITPTIGQSPFAFTRGRNFERVLFRNAAQRLREALVRAGVLPDGAQGFSDFRLRLNGGPMHTLDEALKETGELLKDIAHDREVEHGASRRSSAEPP